MSSFQWIPKAVLSTCQPKVKQTLPFFLICKQFSREVEVCQNIVNKSDNFSREIEVGQINVNKSDNFPREIEVGQIKCKQK